MDIDVEGYYEKWCEIMGEEARSHPTQRTGSGGYQIFYRDDNPGRNQKLAWHIHPDGRKEIAIETRGEGGYIVVPPSLHPSGGVYEWLADMPRVIPRESPETAFNAARSLDMTPEPSEEEITAARASAERREAGKKPAGGVIDAYNHAHNIEDVLLSYTTLRSIR